MLYRAGARLRTFGAARPKEDPMAPRRHARFIGVSVATLVAAAVVAQAQGPSETASQFYKRYRAAFDKAKAFEDIAPYMSSRARKDPESRSAEERKKMFGLIKLLGAVLDPKVVKEEKTAAGVTLTVEGIEPTEKSKATGTIQLIREDGAWKVDSESWSS
jgi:hypothetical protein